MKKLLSLLWLFSTVLFLASCGDDDDDDDDNNDDDMVMTPSEFTIADNITENTTWESGNIYILDGRIFVEEGATLTIEAGTVVKAETGQEANASALIIRRGAQIMANGTASEPIIFTSVLDAIQPGEIIGSLAADNRGQWGGLIVLGNAPISASNDNDEDVSEVQIEGIPTTVDALYGGTDAADNSGVIRYVSIRHSGTDIGAGNELQGLTLGGVGSGTTIENIEIVASNDDGIEWFGGDVDIDNVLIWNSADDGLDTDQDWQGTCSNFIIVTPEGSAFELDGPEGSAATERGNFGTFTNGTVFAGSGIDHLVDWDGSTNAVLTNIYFYGMDADYGFLTDEDPEEAGDQNFLPFESFGGNEAGTSTGFQYTLTEGQVFDDVFVDVPASAISEVGLNMNTVGPTTEAGFEWTWASQSGALSDIGL